ncbi:MAG: glycosyltransferase family 9 protein [Thermoanaerobaculales bacterium]
MDRWVGAPVCAVLTVVRRLDDLLLRRTPASPPKRIAVIKLAEQGATVLAYSALSRARAMVGADNVFFVVFSENRFILDLLDVLPKQNVVVIRTDGLVRLVADTFKALLRLRREDVDATVDFEFFARSSAILSYLSGAGARAGYHAYFGEASYRGDLMTHRHAFNPFLHASEMFQGLVESLRRPPDDLPALELAPLEDEVLPRLQPSSAEVTEVETLVRRELAQDHLPPLILFNANCGDLLPLRRWPTERYVELAERLIERLPEARIVLTGAPNEARQAEALVAEIDSKHCVSMAGKTSLRQLLVLYGLAEIMVTNDSGPAHYATLTPMDVVTIFGPETPAVFGARAPTSHLLWAGLVCSPCVNAFNDRQSACTRNICMERITVDMVFEKIVGVYEKRRTASA